MAKKLVAELLGTAILVYFGCGVATLMFGFGLTGTVLAAGVVATALAFGLVLAGLAYAIGPISGAHVNPAVTLGMLLSRRIELPEAVGYWAAQFVGGIVGALVLYATFQGTPRYSRTGTGLGANGWGPGISSIGINWAGAFTVEVVMTAVFVLVILGVTAKGASPVVAGLMIGLTLAMVHLLGILMTGTSVNPARSFGPALIVGGTALHQVWLFIVAPLVGGVIAAVVHLALSAERPAASSTSPTAPAPAA
jgi:aquaporin Z